MASHPPKATPSKRSGVSDTLVGSSFRIEEEIGKGSFATVYRGYHRQSRAIVAIKSVNLAKLNKKLKDNLYSEIDILKGLQHPHIVALIDCKESATHIHLVMEFCELGDLSFFIKKRDRLISNPATAEMARKYPNPPAGGLNEVITRHFLKQLSSALEFLRARNFIHRDVKPQNLLLLPSPQFLANTPDAPLIMSASEKSFIPSAGIDSLPMLKLADFGFARSLPATSLAETLCGSPLYMAPEILRYEKYDAKADLWSVGTVLFEMVTGKPPFRASNHVELLRKIEQGEDVIRFPKDSVVSAGMKSLIRSLLKRNPVERLSFENFFSHEVVKETIPGLVGDDRPREARTASRSEDSQPMRRQLSNREGRRVASERDAQPIETPSRSSPRDRDPVHRGSLPRDDIRQAPRQVSGTPPRIPTDRIYSTSNPQGEVRQEITGTKRPSMYSAATAPTRQALQEEKRPNVGPSEMVRGPSRTSRPSPSPGSSLLHELKDKAPPRIEDKSKREERDRAVQDAMVDREYVIVEKTQIEVNALADEMAANPRVTGAGQTQSPLRSGPMPRRATTQGAPASATGAVPPTASRAVQIAQGRQRPEAQRQPSYERRYGGSPTSTTSAISKAIQGASLRLFGIGVTPHLLGKGSPPQLYGPFPAYPVSPVAGLIGDRKSSGPLDEDTKAIQDIEDSATRSDVVYGFAEVKYKQLIPLAPSVNHGLGGPEERSNSSIQEDGLTPDAVVALSEEALVLYVKALSLLAKSMQIAGAWWHRKSRGEVINSSNYSRTDTTAAAARINNVVQWVRSRFNEVLEKAEFSRLKLIDAQKSLPEDHPGHPNNHTSASNLTGAPNSSSDGVFLSTGVTAEKLMYDRALEMSRSAAISEIANEDLPGCDISYMTAIRMLEAVLENDDDVPPRKSSIGQIEEKDAKAEEAPVNGINIDDRQAVQKVLGMVRTRQLTLRKKMAVIAKHQSQPQNSSRPPSSHSSGATTTIANTPPNDSTK